MRKFIFLLLVGTAAPAVAQTRSSSNEGQTPAAEGQVPVDRTTSAGSDSAGDIIVTAQRRSENVLRVPLSVEVVSGETLAQRGVNDLNAITRLTPSLQVAQDNTFSVRGIGTATFATTVESSVSQVVDEVVLGNNEFATNAFYDVERVEVLSGPQGLLFGKNASAGLVNITTTRPKLGVLSESADAEVVNRDRPVSDGQGYQLRNTLNVPIGSISALRLNLLYSDQDPLTYPRINPAVRNDLGSRNLGARLKYLIEPSDALSIYLIGDYNRQRGIGGRYDVTFRQFGAGSAYVPLGLSAGPNNLTYEADAPNYRDAENGGVQANIGYRMASGVQITNITAWKRSTVAFQFDSDNTPVNFFSYNNARSRFDQFSEELRFTLPEGARLTGQGGLYYYHSANKTSGFRGGNNGLPSFIASQFPFCINPPTLGAPPAACPAANSSFLGQDYRFSLKQDSYAAFGQLGYKITDTLRLNLGGRLTYDKAAIDLLENTGHYFVTLGVPNNRTEQSTDNTNFSFRVGADWQATPDVMVYGFYGHGYKGPGFSNTSPAPGANLAVRPEISKGGEFGVKGRAFDRHLTFSVSAFYTRFTDLQVQSFVQALRTFVLSNAATATTKGVDISFQARAGKYLTFSGSAVYADANFNDYPGAQCYPTQITGGCRADLNSSDPAFVGSFNASGYQVPLSAKFTSTLGIEYDPPLTAGLNGQFGLDFYHRSGEPTAIGAPFTVPSWNTLDAHVGVKAENWNVSLFCKNCTNAIRPTSIGSDGGDANPVQGLPVLTLSQRFGYDSVRTVGVRLGVNF